MKLFPSFLLAVLLTGLVPRGACGAVLELAIRHTVAGEPLELASPRYRSAAGEPLSFDRASYLLTGFALETPDGSWRELTNQVAWMDAGQERTVVRLDDVPAGFYRSLRFHFGPDAALNHAPATNYPARHPLNPNLNGLHWSWQGGYIFLALEGRWRNGAGAGDGWSYHLARDTNRVRINLPAALDLTRDQRMELDFDLGAVLRAPRAIGFARDGSSTHSREGDPVAAALVANLPGALRVRRILPLKVPVQPAVLPPLYLPERWTAFPFMMSGDFPVPDLPRDNPLVVERVKLGERLFHEPRLSRDGTISCASCHGETTGFSDPRRFSVGVGGRVGTRHAMPLFNLAWKTSFFWDGRAPSLRAQALEPIQDHAEMDESLDRVVGKLQSADYADDFRAAFRPADITAEKIGLALEAYLLTLTSFDSRFDRALRGGGELNAEERRGLELFMTEYDPRRGLTGADCFHCHGGALFQGQLFANNGLESNPSDRGRGKITGRAADDGRFATPSLRNVAVTAPYMHDGRFATLEEVVRHYSSGVKRSPTLDPNLAKHPDGGLQLSEADQRALVAFLKTLTDPRWEPAAAP